MGSATFGRPVHLSGVDTIVHEHFEPALNAVSCRMRLFLGRLGGGLFFSCVFEEIHAERLRDAGRFAFALYLDLDF